MLGGNNMNIRIAYLAITFFVIFLVAGCSTNEEQKIEVQIRVGDEAKYEDFKEVIDNEQVVKAKKILDDTDWKNAKVSMSRPADYRFAFPFKNSDIEAKVASYSVWINPKKDKLEIVRENDEYAQLSKEDSAILFEIITGKKLTDVK